MTKAKRLITAALVVMFLGSLAGCIIYERGGYRRHYSGHDYHGRGWDRR